MDFFARLSQRLNGNVMEGISLAPYTTFKIGGNARYFFIAHSTSALTLAARTAWEAKLPLFILGGGSNLLISDQGFDGLVIKNQTSEMVFTENRVIADSGLSWGMLVACAYKRGLVGLEELAHIPGTVGGAVRGNAGSMGKETADVLKRVLILKIEEKEPRWLPLAECGFYYRESIFKTMPWIILKADFFLTQGDVEEKRKVFREYLQRRASTQPLDKPCPGCVFKNPPGFFASRLIEECGLKGYQYANIRVSPKHANFMENLGNGTAREVLSLIALVKDRVRKKFGIALEEEIVRVGL